MRAFRPLTLLIISNIISGFAQGISLLAIPWYFVSIIHSPEKLTLMYMLVLVGSVFWGLYSGTLIDKYPRKNIFLFFSIIGGIVLCTASATGLIYPEGVPTFMVITVFACTAYVNGIYYPALYAFAQEVSTPEKYNKVNSLLEIQSQAMTIASGGVASILLQGINIHNISIGSMAIPLTLHIKAWSLSRIFLVDGITYFIAVILISMIKHVPHTAHHHEDGTVWERFKTGNNFLRANPLIFIFGITSLSIFVFLLIDFNTLVPIFVVNRLHKDVTIYALTDVYYAAGALLAGVFTARLFKSTNSIKMILFFIAATFATLAVCTFSRSVWVYFTYSFLLGITNAGTRILRITYIFHHVPNNLTGRVNSVLNMVGTLFRIGLAMIFSLPFFAQGENVIWALLICVVFMAMNFILLFLNYTALRGRYPDKSLPEVV